MTNQYAEFLVAATSSSPGSLPESIRQVGNLSAGFCRSWLANENDDALATSEEAFQLLDHIQNELLRHGEEKSKLPCWSADPFKMALDEAVGVLLDPVTQSDMAYFRSLARGAGALPPDASPVSLTLAVALNKLKHRNTSATNFSISSSGTHVLYIFTPAGMGKSDTISSFDIRVLCCACKIAMNAI